MTARTGLFTAPVPGTPPVGTSPVDGRLALGALFGTTYQVPSGGGVNRSGSAMSFTLAAGTVFIIPDPTTANAVFVSPYDTVAMTTAAGPSTGSRIDIIQVKQNDYANGDADSRVQVNIKQGVAGGSPTAPTPDAGYQVHATITVPTNATTASQCSVSYAAPQNFAAPPIQVSTLALLRLIVGENGQTASVTADSNVANNGEYLWTGGTTGSWIMIAGDTGWIQVTVQSPATGTLYVRKLNCEVFLSGTTTPTANNQTQFYLPTGFLPFQTVEANLNRGGGSSAVQPARILNSGQAQIFTQVGSGSVNWAGFPSFPADG